MASNSARVSPEVTFWFAIDRTFAAVRVPPTTRDVAAGHVCVAGGTFGPQRAREWAGGQ